MNKTCKGILSGLALIFTVSTHAETQTAAVLATGCTGCHGSDGTGNGRVPNIRALNPSTFQNAMQAYKSGARRATVMNRIAQGFSETDIAELARYFSRGVQP